MKTPPIWSRFSIARKIALISWLVTIATLVAFVAMTLPQQKRTFMENLASKARGLTASLQDVIAGAAVTEDYSAVVDHCRQVLQGDDSIRYIVITKNDGFSLIHESGQASGSGAGADSSPPRWRIETLGPYWHPPGREAFGGIDQVPVLNLRVFHFSRPFNYSGLEWGWIHVGLSLESYDRSVRRMYLQTILLGLACAGLSLLASVLYSRRLIRPIHALQGVLDKVSDGDLSVRADIKTRDEVEDLATSFNAMTESLLQRDQILESVRYAAQVLLLTPDWNEVVHFVLASLGQSTRVCRVDVFVIGPTKDGRLRADHPYAWTDPHGPAGAPRKDPAPDAGDQPDLAGLAEAVDSLGMTAGLISQLPHGFQTLFLPLGTVSVAAAPIKAGGALWGILSLSECVKARDWTESETDSLRAVADTLGAAIHRKSVQDALLDAKATLEHRVEERTQELQEQVAAKEKAHTELAEAQQHLMSASRQAGMAEVATGVLHNVGNVLNSINVSATLIDQQLKASEVSVLADLSRLLQQQEADLGTFLSTDPRGKEVLPFLAELADRLKVENTRTQTEHLHLIRNLDHVKDVINMQQSYGRASGYLERMAISGLMEDALRLHTASLRRHRIQVLRQFEDLPLIQVDKSKVLQILVNLVKNALESLVLSDQKERRLTVTISRRAADVVEVSVCDNGVGIPAENLTRIFSHGFSTRKGGHGFGLHIAALAAREMAGELRVHSAGAGLGALFTLSLPIPDHSVEEEEER